VTIYFSRHIENKPASPSEVYAKFRIYIATYSSFAALDEGQIALPKIYIKGTSPPSDWTGLPVARRILNLLFFHNYLTDLFEELKDVISLSFKTYAARVDHIQSYKPSDA